MKSYSPVGNFKIGIKAMVTELPLHFVLGNTLDSFLVAVLSCPLAVCLF